VADSNCSAKFTSSPCTVNSGGLGKADFAVIDSDADADRYPIGASGPCGIDRTQSVPFRKTVPTTARVLRSCKTVPRSVTQTARIASPMNLRALPSTLPASTRDTMRSKYSYSLSLPPRFSGVALSLHPVKLRMSEIRIETERRSPRRATSHSAA
jgi:hypothetical protein